MSEKVQKTLKYLKKCTRKSGCLAEKHKEIQGYSRPVHRTVNIRNSVKNISNYLGSGEKMIPHAFLTGKNSLFLFVPEANRA